MFLKLTLEDGEVTSGVDRLDLARRCRDEFFTAHPEIDCLIVTDPANVAYLTGYRSLLQDMGSYAQAAVATPDRVVLVTGASDAAAALERLGDPAAIQRYGRFFVFGDEGRPTIPGMPEPSETFLEGIDAALAQGAPRARSVAVEAIAPEVWSVAERRCPGGPPIDAAPLLRQARSVKLPGELALLRRASAITSEALEEILPLVREGVRELDIAAELSARMIRRGGLPRFVVVTSGERTSRVDAHPRDRALRTGDLLRIDLGCAVEGYHSDMARTFVVGGDPDTKTIARYDALLCGEQAQLAMIRPGIAVSDLFDVAVRVVRSGALPDYRRNHCGHGIGLSVHEFPTVAPDAGAVVEAGMVLCLETPYYELGWGGMMVEDTVIVSPTGCEVLTPASRSLAP